MGIIKEILISYAFSAFLGGFLEFFAPERAKSTLRAIVAAVIIFAVAYPLAKGEISLPEDEIMINEEKNETDALMHIAALTEKTVKNDLKNLLINLGINEYEIYVTTSVDEENSTVYLENVRVELGADFRKDAERVYDSVTADYKSVLKVGVKNE